MRPFRVFRVLLVLLLTCAAATSARATDRFAELTGKSCISCHMSASGGTLTSAGRSYKNARDLFAPDDSKKEDEDEASAAPEQPPSWPISGSFMVTAGRFEQAFPDHSESTYGAYGDLRLRVDRVFGREELSFNTEVIGVANHGNDTIDDPNKVRLITAYLRWNKPGEPLDVKAGRQFVSTGPRPLFLDGIDFYDRLSSLFDLEVFGGLPTDNGFGGADGDFAFGGRLGITPAEILNIGLSGIYTNDDHDPSFMQTGMDASLQASEALDFSGHVFWDYLTGDFYDTLVRARYEFSEQWALRADYSHVIPASFLPKTSIFWVFSDSAINEVSVDLSYMPNFDWRYHAYVRGDYFEDGGQTVGGGGGFDHYYGYHRENAVGLEVLYLDQSHEADAAVRVGGDLFQLRAYQRQEWTQKIFTALDLVTDFFTDDDFDPDSYSAGVLLGYRFTPMIILVLGVDYLNTVQYEGRVDVHAKVSYAF